MSTPAERQALAQLRKHPDQVQHLLKHHLERHLDLLDWQEQQAQKLRNWRLKHPSFPPPL